MSSAPARRPGSNQEQAGQPPRAKTRTQLAQIMAPECSDLMPAVTIWSLPSGNLCSSYQRISRPFFARSRGRALPGARRCHRRQRGRSWPRSAVHASPKIAPPRRPCQPASSEKAGRHRQRQLQAIGWFRAAGLTKDVPPLKSVRVSYVSPRLRRRLERCEHLHWFPAGGPPRTTSSILGWAPDAHPGALPNSTRCTRQGSAGGQLAMDTQGVLPRQNSTTGGGAGFRPAMDR